MNITMSIEELRDIIEGKIIFRKCPSCGGTGEWLYVDGYDLPVSPVVYGEAGGRGNINNSTEGCGVCDCLGYLPQTKC